MAPRRLFGTDGVRGLANTELTAELAVSIGRAAGSTLSHGPAVVGRDTRRSGEMLSGALQAGFHSAGIDTNDLGIMPVGAIARLTASTGATMGVSISASHNPAADNGVKLLNSAGFKLSDAEEDEIESRVRDGVPGGVPIADAVGTRFPFPHAERLYLEFLASQIPFQLNGVEVALDAAHGAAYRVAPAVFKRLKADVEVYAADPDGTNINDGVGATNPDYLSKRAGGRVGFAFDGDADRLIAIDEDGVPANGDVIMAVVARHLKEQDRLRNNVVVTTVMANLGFRQAMSSLDIEVVETSVGDRYVLEAMRERKAILGGEQSGHVIFLRSSPTGDGLLTSLKLLEVMVAGGKQLRELRREVITEYPQVLRNVRVPDTALLEGAEGLWTAVEARSRQLGEEGRILVRASGTEPLVRVMVEASTREEAVSVADELADLTRRELT